MAMLQEISPNTGQAPITCRCADCLFPECIMRPSSYRISIEKRVATDAKYYSAPDEPIAPLSQVLRSGRGSRGLYGLGRGGQEWYCVQCFERLLAIYHQREHRIHPTMTATTVHPVSEVAYYILAEERETVGRSGKLMLCSTKQHGLKLWEARDQIRINRWLKHEMYNINRNLILIRFDYEGVGRETSEFGFAWYQMSDLIPIIPGQKGKNWRPFIYKSWTFPNQQTQELSRLLLDGRRPSRTLAATPSHKPMNTPGRADFVLYLRRMEKHYIFHEKLELTEGDPLRFRVFST